MESSPQINLYIETTVHGPRQQGGRWMYLLEFVTRRGDPVTLWKVGDWEAEKENVLIMQALSAALDRLRLPCVINAHAGSSQIRSTIANGWLEEWQERGWKTAKGQDIKHKDLWAGDCAENGSAFGLYAVWRALIPALDAGETEKNG